MQSLRMVLVAAMLLSMVRSCDGYNILFLMPYGTRSHFETFKPAMEALSARGHNVSYLVGLPFGTQMANVTVHVMHSLVKFLASHGVTLYDVNQKMTDMLNMTKLVNIMVIESCPILLNDPIVRSIAKDRSVHYDVVIVDPSLAECGLALISLLGHPPFIYYSTYHLYGSLTRPLMIHMPLSYVPSGTMATYDLRHLEGRLTNAYHHYKLDYLRTQALEHILQDIVQRVYPTVSSLLEITSNASFVFTNSHAASLDTRRPLAGYIAEVGGTHLRPAKQLPRDLEEFVNGSRKHGFIYVSFGTYVSDKEMGEDKVNAFIGAFRKLKQRVVWKTSIHHISNLPSNVRMVRWTPQQDLLGSS